jgi:hypothetical protein
MRVSRQQSARGLRHNLRSGFRYLNLFGALEGRRDGTKTGEIAFPFKRQPPKSGANLPLTGIIRCAAEPPITARDALITGHERNADSERKGETHPCNVFQHNEVRLETIKTKHTYMRIINTPLSSGARFRPFKMAGLPKKRQKRKCKHEATFQKAYAKAVRRKRG